MNYRALDDLFHMAQQREAEATYTFSVQMLEIYNEQVRGATHLDALACKGSASQARTRLTAPSPRL